MQADKKGSLPITPRAAESKSRRDLISVGDTKCQLLNSFRIVTRIATESEGAICPPRRSPPLSVELGVTLEHTISFSHTRSFRTDLALSTRSRSHSQRWWGGPKATDQKPTLLPASVLHLSTAISCNRRNVRAVVPCTLVKRRSNVRKRSGKGTWGGKQVL